MAGNAANNQIIPARENNSLSFQVPILTATNYTIWAVKIKAIFNVHGIWEVIEPGTETDSKKNNMAIAYLFQALPEELVLQVAQFSKVKEIWDALKTRFVGIDRVKETRLQTLESDFESLKKKDNESLDVFAGKISQLASQASNLGNALEDKRLVRKLLGSVPEKFIQIVAAIEQFADLNTMPFQEAVGRLKAFEERIKKPTEEGDMHGKLLFTKTDGKEKEKEHKCEHCGCGSSNHEDLGRGRGRGRGSGRGRGDGRFQRDKSHIRCYKCNELGHFVNECPKWEKKEEVNLTRYEDDEPALL